MKKNKRIFILGIVILVLILIAGALLLINNAKSNFLSNQNSTSQDTDVSPQVLDIINNTQTITVTSDGFNPKTVTVKEGGRVLWTNQSEKDASVNSDPYPNNSYWKFLNLGVFANGQSMSLTFDKKGTYTYHNQLNPEQNGTIIVN